MQYVVVNQQFQEMQQALPPPGESRRLPALVELAWHSRQRNTPQALVHSAEANSLLDGRDAGNGESALLRARLLLVRAEASWLFADLDAALGQAQAALGLFAHSQHWAGCSDAHLHIAECFVERGDSGEFKASIHRAGQCAARVQDPQRCAFVEARSAFWWAARDVKTATAEYQTSMELLVRGEDRELLTRACDVLSRTASARLDYRSALEWKIKSFDAALNSGQVLRAVTVAGNLAMNLLTLSDNLGAAEWIQRAIDLARPAGWARCLGLCLTQMATVLAKLQHHDAADAAIGEAEVAMASLSNSFNYALLMRVKAERALTRGLGEDVLQSCAEIDRVSELEMHGESRFTAQHHRSKALALLGRGQEAWGAAVLAYTIGQQTGKPHTMAALGLLAEIHGQFDLPTPPDMVEPNAALHFLGQALDVVSSINGFPVPIELLVAFAERSAAAGNYERAYLYSLKASAAREASRTLEAGNLAIAMQVRHETERARMDAQQHEQLAASESLRAEDFAQIIGVLQRLGVIGQEITAHLDTDAVFATLDRHVQELLNVSSFAIMLIDDEGRTLEQAFGVEQGKPLPLVRIDLSHPASNTARCAREKRQLVLHASPAEPASTQRSNTLRTLSALFAPLMLGDEVLGVMTIQSLQPQAYAEREQLVFRTLCTYGAIALANAHAYRRLGRALADLREAQSELVRKSEVQARMNAERDVTLAFLAHDLRAPLVAIATLLQDASDELVFNRVGRFARQALSMTDRFLTEARLSPPSQPPA
jgi:hypothetical protein